MLYCYNNICVGSFEEREFVASFFFERCKPLLIKDVVGKVMLLSWRGIEFGSVFVDDINEKKLMKIGQHEYNKMRYFGLGNISLKGSFDLLASFAYSFKIAICYALKLIIK